MPRPVSIGAEKHLDQYYPVLDHGFIGLVDYMGSDEAIEQAARVSYARGTRAVNQTRGLVRYLRRHRHTTPTEMGVVKFHVAMPIFVARQWVRHRTASINEMSGRYSLLPHVTYTPNGWRLQSASNAQGSSEGTLCCKDRVEAAKRSQEAQEGAFRDYEWLNEHDVARELSRINLPLSSYTQWYWKMDIHNLFHFLGLRCDPHAQWEIRVYANIIAGIMKDAYPLSFEAWYDYAFQSVTFSRVEREILQAMFSNDGPLMALPEVGLSNRELEEFIQKIKPPVDQMPNFLLPEPLTQVEAFGRLFPGETFEEDS